jgi:elongation factor Ts
MEISAADVKKLRDRTGMQMMKCKAALEQAGGDMDKAVDLLRKQNKEAQDKFGTRETAEGRVGAYIDPTNEIGGIIELRCETAPSARNELFVKLANDLAKQVAVQGEATPEAFLCQAYVDDPKKTVGERIGEVVGLIRENMKPARMARLTGLLGSYVHHDGSIGVLLEVEGAKADPDVLRGVCAHIAAMNPVAVRSEDVPREKVDKEREIARAQAAEQGRGKPANIIEKIAEGKLNTWFKEHVLAEQAYVKDPSKTVGQVLAAAGLKPVKFVRYKVGEVTG